MEPTNGIQVDYTEVTGKKWDALPKEEFVGMVSSTGFVGDPVVDTQHFIGGSKFERTGEDTVTGYHQLRAAHQRYTGPDKKTVVSSKFPQILIGISSSGMCQGTHIQEA